MATQLVLPLQTIPNYTQEKWIISDCNAFATQWILDWENWKRPKFSCVYGPKSSGKTHLAHIFQALTDAVFLQASDTEEWPRTKIDQTPDAAAFILEDFQDINEAWFFSLYNILLERDLCLLLTSSQEPSEWDFETEDVRSRLRSMTLLKLAKPDDALIGYVLRKQLQDRGIAITEADIAYLLQRIPRSFEAMRIWAEKLDACSLLLNKKISRALIHDLLQTFEKKNDPAFQL